MCPAGTFRVSLPDVRQSHHLPDVQEFPAGADQLRDVGSRRSGSHGAARDPIQRLQAQPFFRAGRRPVEFIRPSFSFMFTSPASDPELQDM